MTRKYTLKQKNVKTTNLIRIASKFETNIRYYKLKKIKNKKKNS